MSQIIIKVVHLKLYKVLCQLKLKKVGKKVNFSQIMKFNTPEKHPKGIFYVT